MAIKTRLKKSTDFSSASMSDLVFLLLIFFILISTLVSPNAIKLLLPNSNSKTMAKQNLTVYINENNDMFIEETLVDPAHLMNSLLEQIHQNDATIVLRADKNVPIQYVVYVIDACNQINELRGTQHKVILATAPKE